MRAQRGGHPGRSVQALVPGLLHQRRHAHLLALQRGQRPAARIVHRAGQLRRPQRRRQPGRHAAVQISLSREGRCVAPTASAGQACACWRTVGPHAFEGVAWCLPRDCGGRLALFGFFAPGRPTRGAAALRLVWRSG
eukprot:3776934-Prymnesium_polylepis.1